LAARELALRDPLPLSEVVLIAVWTGDDDVPTGLVEAVGDREHVVGTATELLALRERQAESIGRLGVPHKLDVTLPLARLAEFAADVQALITGSDQVFLFGHLGDGNLHVNIVGPSADDEAMDSAVLRLVSRYGGSISAEHGIGRAKAQWLSLVRSDVEIATMRAIKDALDPDGLLNPGVLFT
jgi:FAD/FMN-containing dehydrogenase